MDFNKIKEKNKEIIIVSSIIILGLLMVHIMINKIPHETSQISKEISESPMTVEEITQEETQVDFIDYSIYDQDKMKENNIKKLDFESYNSMEDVINSTIEDVGIPTELISVVYYNFQNGESYDLNGNQYRVAASTVKMPYACVYYDLLNNNMITLDTQIPYNDAYYAEGMGSIANSDKKPSYALEEVLSEMLINSDNTAAVMLYQYYSQVYGNMESAMANFVGMSDMPPEYYSSNLLSANFLMNSLINIGSYPERYSNLAETMQQEKNVELFRTYVPHGMANKFGRFETAINDCGIYYEDNIPQYALVVMTEDAMDDSVLEVLNLRVNEWYHYEQKNGR